MHLDRKSDTGHKKCTAHGSQDAEAGEDKYKYKYKDKDKQKSKQDIVQ